MISAFDFAGFGPPRSQRSGCFCFSNCVAQAWFAQATCLTCSANVRAFANAPCVGLNVHLSSGIASARRVKSFSTLFQIRLMESGTVLDCGRFSCAFAREVMTKAEASKRCAFFRMAAPERDGPWRSGPEGRIVLAEVYRVC